MSSGRINHKSHNQNGRDGEGEGEAFLHLPALREAKAAADATHGFGYAIDKSINSAVIKQPGKARCEHQWNESGQPIKLAHQSISHLDWLARDPEKGTASHAITPVQIQAD